MNREYRIAVIIVNYRTADLTLSCLDTLKDQLDRDADHLVVADNDSGSDEIVRIMEGIRGRGLTSFVTILPLKENNGFSSGNNAGIQSVRARYYLLANSDTLFMPEAVKELFEAAEAFPKAGIVSPRLQWPDGKAQVSCFRFYRPPSEMIRSADTGIVTSLLRRFDVPIGPTEEMTAPEWTSFACVLVRREVFEAIGLLDDGYFMYFEDVDFCRRTREAGFDIINRPRSRVVHLQGRSSDVDSLKREMRRLPDYYYHSRARYYFKYFGRLGFIAANLLWLVGRPVSLIKQLLLRRERSVPQAEAMSIWKVR